MKSQFKKGIVEICIMKTIEKKEMYGVEIVSMLSKPLDVNENTIYPILRRLVEQGIFSSYEIESPVGPPRKYYKITEVGKEKLTSYLEEWFSLIDQVLRILGNK